MCLETWVLFSCVRLWFISVGLHLRSLQQADTNCQVIRQGEPIIRFNHRYFYPDQIQGHGDSEPEQLDLFFFSLSLKLNFQSNAVPKVIQI